jgi:RimJ/RimL family protein N-acetyltransferase
MTLPTTPRLRLREAMPSDAPFVLRLINEPGWHRYINDPGVRTEAQALAWMEGRLFKSYREDGFGFWLIERREDGALLGLCGLFRRPVLEGPDLGYALLAEHEGCGYAFEAADACVAYARDRLGWAELLAITSPENPKSHALLRRLGFVEEGLRQLEGYNEPSRVWRLRL